MGYSFGEYARASRVHDTSQSSKSEAGAHEITIAEKHREYERIVQQLATLLLRYTSPENAHGELMTEYEYASLRTILLKQKTALEADFKARGREIEEWVELLEWTFNFARYARVWFAEGDLDTRRAIFACLGSRTSC